MRIKNVQHLLVQLILIYFLKNVKFKTKQNPIKLTYQTLNLISNFHRNKMIPLEPVLTLCPCILYLNYENTKSLKNKQIGFLCLHQHIYIFYNGNQIQKQEFYTKLKMYTKPFCRCMCSGYISLHKCTPEHVILDSEAIFQIKGLQNNLSYGFLR